MFRFKQFSVDQTGCAMKINTDGVLLGALAEADGPKSILDIGTGTGVIALMLAQRFTDAMIDAVEIDPDATKTARKNFRESSFAKRLQVFDLGFEEYFQLHGDKKYDLIVSNPPFYVSSLKSPGAKKNLAKHTDVGFFEQLIIAISAHLTPIGYCWLVLPLNLFELVVSWSDKHGLFLKKTIYVRSYPDSPPHRVVVSLSLHKAAVETNDFEIYSARDVYSEKYRNLLQPYFIAF